MRSICVESFGDVLPDPTNNTCDPTEGPPMTCNSQPLSRPMSIFFLHIRIPEFFLGQDPITLLLVTLWIPP